MGQVTNKALPVAARPTDFFCFDLRYEMQVPNKMQGDKDSRSSHNVMRRFLPLVLWLVGIQIAYNKQKQTDYLNYP